MTHHETCSSHIAADYLQPRLNLRMFDFFVGFGAFAVGLAVVAHLWNAHGAFSFDLDSMWRIAGGATMMLGSHLVAVRLPTKSRLTFAPTEVSLFYCLIALSVHEMFLASVVTALVFHGALSRWSREAFNTSALMLAEYAIAYFVADVFTEQLDWPQWPAILVAVLVSGAIANTIAMYAGAYRSGRKISVRVMRMHLIMAAVTVVSLIVTSPVATLVRENPWAALLGSWCLLSGGVLSHRQYSVMQRSRHVDAFDQQTAEPDTPAAQVLAALTEQLCFVGHADRAHVRVVPLAQQAEKQAIVPSSQHAACELCGMTSAPLHWRTVDVFCDGYAAIVELGRNADTAGSFSPSEQRAVRQLTRRAGSRWESAHHVQAANWRAEHDEVTGLPNGAALAVDLAEPQTEGRLLAVLRCGGLSEVRAATGIDGQAAAIVAMVEALRQARRDAGCGTCYRLGEATFAVLLDAERAATLADMLAHVRRGVGQTADIHTTVAMSFCEIDPGVEPVETIRRAHVSLCQAERTSAVHPIEYDADMDSAAVARAKTIAALRKAIDAGAITVAFQPQMNAQTLQVVGCEVLARWIDDELGFVSPAEFVPLAQEAGLMPDLTAAVVEQALRACSVWQNTHPGIRLSVNVAGTCLVANYFADRITAAVQQSGVEPQLVTLELTENVLVDDTGLVISSIEKLQSRGFEVSLDDFGTGYSSLAALQDLPVDEVKIDRSFVLNAGRSAHGLDVLRHIVSLMRCIDVRVVAEGVEDDEMAVHLQRFACDVIQGYVYAKPMAPTDLLAWLAEHPQQPAGAAQVGFRAISESA